MPKNSKDIAFVTPTFRHDFDRFQFLLESLERFSQRPIKHYIAVPSRELSLFQKNFFSHDRVFFAQEEIVPPYWYPVFKSILGVNKHRGWLIQQIVKLSVPKITTEEDIVFIDSDNIFIRPFSDDAFFKDGKLRLFRTDTLVHPEWIKASKRILKIDPNRETNVSYINPMIGWKKSVLDQMCRHIENIHGKPWHRVFFEEPIFSEYNTYGLYYELFVNDGNHTISNDSLTYNVWSQAQYLPLLENLGKKNIPENYIAILIQSNIDIRPEEYRAMITMLWQASDITPSLKYA